MYSIPPFQPQSAPPFDAFSCSNEAFIGCVEMVSGNFQEWSVSGLAVQSGTRPGIGNSIDTVTVAANKYGLISYATRPLSPVFNQTQYFAPVTAQQLAFANKTKSFTLVPPDLNISPIILRLLLGYDANNKPVYHFVLTRDLVDYIDSYEPQIKPIIWSQVKNQWSLLIKPKYMTYGYQVAGNPTVYVQVGNSLVPLATWQAFINICGSQESIVFLTQQQLDASSVIGNDYFGSKN